MSDCITTPERPFVPGVPAYTRADQVYGWASGANSIQQFSGDARIRFTMEAVTGVVLGLTNTRATPDNMQRISHGFLFNRSPGGAARWQVVEAGVTRSGAATYVPGVTEFRVDRAGPQVTYFVDGELVYASRFPFTGPSICATALYASGDTAPAEAW